MNLGLAIIKVRKIRGYNQKKLATLCEITPSYLSQIESNKKEPNLATLKKISLKLSFPLPVIFAIAMDDDDVPQERKEAFEFLKPFIKSLFLDFFI